MCSDYEFNLICLLAKYGHTKEDILSREFDRRDDESIRFRWDQAVARKMRKPLDYLFIWVYQPEGEHYWYDLYEKIRPNNFHYKGDSVAIVDNKGERHVISR